MNVLDSMVAGWKSLDRIKASLDPVDRVHALAKIFNVSSVSGLEKSQGILLVGKHAIYIAEGYLLKDNEMIVEIELPESLQQLKTRVSSKLNVVKSSSTSLASTNATTSQQTVTKSELSHSIKRIRYETLRELHKRRFLFRETGLEFFGLDGSNFLVVFETQRDRDWLHNAVVQEMVLFNASANTLGVPQELRAGTETMLASGNGEGREGFASSLVGGTAGWKRQRDRATKDWLAGKMSNFAYLMVLNTLAGRSFNDITQYPVFPWILSDYSSEELDLTNPNSFRDLSKPMGALSAERAAVVKERYASMVANGDIPFHYGTHYSCSAYVLHYLIRIEPYTTAGLQLQGGTFDHPDRLFKSIESTWKSAAGLLDNSFNVQDVRELVPEFFYLPEFLVNTNRFSFGATQAGDIVGDVELPKWAKGSPTEFIRLHRKALESKFVSESLHLWIDLIFGSSQRNEAAAEALNVFHRYTYEGQVNLEEINDPTAKAAAEAFIHNFGQTPQKLFSKPHPKKIVPSYPGVPSKYVDPNTIAWHSHLAPPLVVPGSFVRPHYSILPAPDVEQTGLPGTIKLIPIADGSTFAPGLGGPVAAMNFGFLNAPASPTTASSGGGFTSSSSIALDTSSGSAAAASATDSSSSKNSHFSISDLFIQNDKVYIGSGQGIRLATPSRYFVFGGDDGLLVMRAVQSALQGGQDKVLGVFAGLHVGKITALTVANEEGSIIVTGGSDATVAIWRTTRDVNWRLDQLGSFLTGHTAPVRCLATNMVHGIAVSGSDDGTCIVWDLGRRRYIRTLRGAGEPLRNNPDGSPNPSPKRKDIQHFHFTNSGGGSSSSSRRRKWNPISHVSINGDNGNIITVAGRAVRIWTMNGELIAETDVGVNLDAPTFALATNCSDYLPGIVLITGHKKGQVVCWDFIYPGGDGEPQVKPAYATLTSSSAAVAVAAAPDTDTNDSLPILAVRTCITNQHRHPITSLCISPCQRHFASGDSSGRVVHFFSYEKLPNM